MEWPGSLVGQVAAPGVRRRCASGDDCAANRGNYCLKRRGWDSNPRRSFRHERHFQCRTFGLSVTSPDIVNLCFRLRYLFSANLAPVSLLITRVLTFLLTAGFRPWPCGVLQTAISPPGLDRTEGATFWQETDGCIWLEVGGGAEPPLPSPSSRVRGWELLKLRFFDVCGLKGGLPPFCGFGQNSGEEADHSPTAEEGASRADHAGCTPTVQVVSQARLPEAASPTVGSSLRDRLPHASGQDVRLPCCRRCSNRCEASRSGQSIPGTPLLAAMRSPRPIACSTA